MALRPLHVTKLQLMPTALKWGRRGAAYLLGQGDPALLPSGLQSKTLPLIHDFLAAGRSSGMLRNVLPSQLQPMTKTTAITLTGGQRKHRCALQTGPSIPIAAQQSCRVEMLAVSRLLHTTSCAKPLLSSSHLLSCLLKLAPASPLQLGAEPSRATCVGPRSELAGLEPGATGRLQATCHLVSHCTCTVLLSALDRMTASDDMHDSERICLQVSEPDTPTVREESAGAHFRMRRSTSSTSSASRMSQTAASAQPSSPSAALHAPSSAADRGLQPGGLPAGAAPTTPFSSCGPGFHYPPASRASAPVPPSHEQEPASHSQRGRRAAPESSFRSTTGCPSVAQSPLPGSSCRNGADSRPTAAACGAPVPGPGAAAAASGRSRGDAPRGAEPQGKGRTGPTTRPMDSKTGGPRQSAPASGGRQAQAEQADLLQLAAEKYCRSVQLEQEKTEQQKRSAGDRRSSHGRAADPAVQAAGEASSTDPAVQAANQVPQQPVPQADASGCTSTEQPRATAPRQQAVPAAAEARPSPEDIKRTAKEKAKEKAAAKAARDAKARMAKRQGYMEDKQKAAAALKAAQEAEATAAAARAQEETPSASAVATAAAEAAQEGQKDATPQPPVRACAAEAAQEGSAAAGQAQMDITADGHGPEATAQAQPVAAASTAAAEPQGQEVQPLAEPAAKPGQAGQQPAAAQPQRNPRSAAASPAVGGTQPAAAVAESAADGAGAAHKQQLNVAEAQQAVVEGLPRAKGLKGHSPQSGSAQQAPAKHPCGQARKAAQRQAAVATPAGDRLQPAAAKAEQAAEGTKGLEGQAPLSEGAQKATAEDRHCPAEEAAQREAGAATPAGYRLQPAAAKADQAAEEGKGLEGQAPRSKGAQKATFKDRRCLAEEAAQPEAGAATVATPAGDRQQSAAKAELPTGAAAHGGQPAAAAAQQEAKDCEAQAKGPEGQRPLSNGTEQAAAEDPRCGAKKAAQCKAGAAAVATPAGNRQQPAAAKAKLPAGAAATGGQPAGAAAQQGTLEGLSQAKGLQGQAPQRWHPAGRC